MSLVYPNRRFPPLPHAETHLAGGSDQLFDQNLNTTDSPRFASLTVDGKAQVGSLGIGSYVLDTLVANNKVPDSDKVDGHHAGTGANNVLVLDSNGLVPLGNIPTNLTGKNADLWDGKHRSDDQTIGGNVTIGGDLRVNGNDIKDSGGTTRITLGSTITLNGDIKVVGNDIIDSGGTTRITLGATTVVNADLQVKGNDIKDSGGTTRITLGGTIILNGDIQVKGNDIKDSGGTVRITLGAPVKFATSISPSSDGGTYLGTSTLRWKKIFIYPTAPDYWWYEAGGYMKQGCQKYGTGTWHAAFDTATNMNFGFSWGGTRKVWFNAAGYVYAAAFYTTCLLENKLAYTEVTNSDWLSILENVPIYAFVTKDNPDLLRFGFIAEHLPRGLQGWERDGDKLVLSGIDMMALLALCIGAIRQLYRKMTEKIAELERQIEDLRSRIASQ